MNFFGSFCARFIFPLQSMLVGLIAYGPWGKNIHQGLIRTFKSLYGIVWRDTSSFDRLGDFFLRDIVFKAAEAPLVSPAEAQVIEGPEKFPQYESVTVKGLSYRWDSFPEIDMDLYQGGSFWNLYLAPHNYHWVHSACEGSSLSAMRVSGKCFPVNGLGRSLCPELYFQNERLSFKWEHPELGNVLQICVGAAAVSQIESCLGPVDYLQWTNMTGRIEKAQKLAGFRLGSSVLLIVEKPGKLEKLPQCLKLAEALSSPVDLKV